MSSLTDAFTTVSVPKNEYERLVRDSEQLSIITNYVQRSDYITHTELKILLDITENEIETPKEHIEKAVNTEDDLK